MLKKISQILYVFLSTFLVLFLIFLWINNELKVDSKIIYLFILILIPFLEPLINTTRKDSEKINLKINNWNNLYKYLSLLVISILLYYYWVSEINILIIFYLIFSILFYIDSRISFLIALILLSSTIVYLIIWDKKLAELLSINAYYFLIIWVIIEIKSNLFPKKEIETSNKNKIVDLINNELEAHNLKEKLDLKLNETKNIAKKVFSKQNIISTKNKLLNIKNKDDDFNKNTLLAIKIVWIILIYKLIETNWEHFTVKNLIYLSIFLLIIFLFKNIILSSVKNIFKKDKNISNNKLSFLKKIIYFIEKNSQPITYLFFILNWLLFIVSYKYDVSNILEKTSILLIIFFIYSIFLNKKYLEENNFKEIISKNYFINKAVIFASIWSINWYVLINSLWAKNNSYIIFLLVFIMFFTIFYFIFYNTKKRELIKKHSSIISKNLIEKNIYAWKKVKEFSPTDFIKNNIYTSLNIILVFAFLITVWIKNDFFKEFYNDHINNIDVINYLVLEDKKVIYKTPKEELIKKVKKSLISWEVEIEESNSWNIMNSKLDNNNIVEIKETINVKDYHTFTTSLTTWSKNKEVIKLEEIMKKLWYFEKEPDKIFDEETRISLVNLLKKECDWPETTKWILGFKAQLCLYGLDIEK